MYKPFSYFFFFIWQFPLLLFAQPRNDNLVLYSLTEQNGLSDNQVNCFFQDSKGFIWIGTQDGLNRYDGSVIKTFKKRNADTTQLLDNRIMAIKEDRAGHIWIVSPSGLNEYDPKNNIFHSYQTEINKNGVYLMNDICFDVSGNMWIASSSGLFEFLPSQKKFKLFINQKGKNFKADNRFTKITIDDKGRICIAGYSGLWQFLPKAEVFQLATTDPADASLINEMLKDHNNKLWLGYWNGGLKFFDPDTKNIFDIDKKNLPVNIFGIAETKNANGDYSIWCDGLYEYKPAEQKTIKHSQPATELNTDFSNSALYFSQDGLLWIGTDKGVRIMDPNKQFFSHHFLSDKQITSQGIAVLQKENMLYVGGAEQNFLKAYDSNFKLIKIVLPPVQIREPGLFTRPAILNLVQEDADHTWLCTERGLVLLNDKTKQTRVFLLTEKDILTPTRNFISNIFIDSRGNHWVFPWRSGIWQIDVKTGQFKKMISGLMQENNEIKKFLISYYY